MYSDNLVNTLNGIAYDYREIINRQLNEILSQPRYRNTGAGLASLHVDVIEGNRDKAPQLVITFADHLNILDKRKIEWTKLPPIDQLDEWADTRTFSGPVPGYKNGLAPNLPPWKVKQRIVWAIAKSKQKFDKWSGKPWRKKSLGSVLKEMNVLVLSLFDKAIEEDLQAGIDKALKAA
jgi:hypothetical protein